MIVMHVPILLAMWAGFSVGVLALGVGLFFLILSCAILHGLWVDLGRGRFK